MGAIKTVMVTGGAGGIGSAICETLAERFKPRIVAVDIDPGGLERLRGLDRLADVDVEYLTQDVADWDAAAATVDRVFDDYGGIDALVTTAGGHQSRGLVHEPFWEASRESIEVDLKNLTGTMAFVHPALGRMIERGSGNIVCISSGKGLRGGPGVAAYSAAKKGVVGLVQATAVEAGPHGVRVNAIAPGGTEARWRKESEESARKAAERIPLRRRTTPEDVGRAVAFLVSEDAAHITGSCLDLTGGTQLH